MSTDRFVKFRINVRLVSEINCHEVCLFADDENLVDRFAIGMMGLDPDELLLEPCPLSAQNISHVAIIARCKCGHTYCGSKGVKICRELDLVIWTALDSPNNVQFLAAQYDAEIERALGDFSWESPDRTAARLLAKAVDRTVLEDRGFEFEWASGRFRKGMLTVYLTLQPGPYQVLLNLPWDGKSIEEIVDRTKLLLSTAPESWPNVEWSYPENGLDSPPISGSGWKEWV
jgi:hypothetical protein